MRENPEVVSHVHTTCKNCVFAEYEGKTQIGCRLNKVDDYRNAGVEVLEVYDDNEYEFYLINGRFCLFYRNQELMENYPRDSWEKIVNLQTKVPYQAIVFMHPDDTLAQVKQSIKALKEQEIKPNLVSLFNTQYPLYAKDPDKYITPSLLLDLLENSGFHRFSLKNVYDESLSERSLIDIAYDNSKDLPYPFYVVFRTRFDIPPQFSKEFNDAILIKMTQLGFATPIDDMNGMIVNRISHKKYSGNSFGVPLEDKILKYEDNGKDFIFKVQDICPCLNR